MVEKSGIPSENVETQSMIGGQKPYLWYLLPA